MIEVAREKAISLRGYPVSKNYDPRMHTAEHVLNRTMTRMFDCGRSFSAHIEKKKSKCDYRLGRGLTTEELKDIEDRVNRDFNTFWILAYAGTTADGLFTISSNGNHGKRSYDGTIEGWTILHDRQHAA
jgi:hypothetical protein